MIHAYSKLYLDSAQDILGHAFDWVANTCDSDPDLFSKQFSESHVGKLFSQGYPRYVAGCNGGELVNMVMEELGLPEYQESYDFYADRSPEYWAGWVLAYFQWYTNRSFQKILSKISIQRFLQLYTTGHEEDIRNVVDTLEEWMK